jgi:hypothetical protein
MNPAQHVTHTGALGRPDGTTHQEVVGLPITRIRYEAAQRDAVRSYWRPTDSERKAIASGALVYLEVLGRTHAPLIIGVDDASDSPKEPTHDE